MESSREANFNNMLIHTPIIAGIIVIILLIAAHFIIFGSGQFARLPRGAKDGTWAQAAIESDHPRFFGNIYDLVDNSILVLRASVLDKRIEVFGRGDTNTHWEQFYVYELEVLESYKGFLSEWHTIVTGDILEIFQYRKLGWSIGGFYYPRVSNQNKRLYFDFIRADINIGDDLIVFLKNHHSFLRYPSVTDEPPRFAFLRHTREHRNGRMIRFGEIERNTIGKRIWGDWQGGTPTPNSLFTLTNQVQAAFIYNSYLDNFESVNPYNNLVLTRENLSKIMNALPHNEYATILYS